MVVLVFAWKNVHWLLASYAGLRCEQPGLFLHLEVLGASFSHFLFELCQVLLELAATIQSVSSEHLKLEFVLADHLIC